YTTLFRSEKIISLFRSRKKREKKMQNPFEMLFPNVEEEEEVDESEVDNISQKRNQLKQLLALGELEDKTVVVDIEEQSPSMFDMLQGSGMEQMGMNKIGRAHV